MHIYTAEPDSFNCIHHLLVKALESHFHILMSMPWHFVQHDAQEGLHHMKSYQDFKGPFKVTDKQTDQQIDQPIDGRTKKAYRDTWIHL